MKKLLILILAAMMVVAFTLPASAFESVFSGFARARAYSQQKFTGEDGDGTGGAVGGNDLSRVDQRYRIGYQAIINDNLKFVTNFEFNSSWGSTGTGRIGQKPVNVKARIAHMQFNAGPLRFTVGQQGYEFGRGFVMSDTAFGATTSFKMGEHLIPFAWFKGKEGNPGATPLDNNAEDEDYVAIYPVFNLGEAFTLNPYIVYGYSDSDNTSVHFGENAFPGADSDGFGLYWIGANVDASLGAFNLWATVSYVGGSVDFNDASDADAKGYAVGVGGNVPLGPASLHGQFVYFSGDDDPLDDDLEAHFGNKGVSYYWSELMGKGMFDSQTVSGANTAATNLWAGNIGATIQPMEKLSLTGDLWYAGKPEKAAATDEDELGFEVDLIANYQLVEGLNLAIVGAYLFADDAVSLDGNNDEDPWEVGTQLSLSF